VVRPLGGLRWAYVSARFDVVGIGNALVDVLVHRDDAFLNTHELVKGSMTLIDVERAVSLSAVANGGVEISGGSAANTMCGVASFGGAAAFIGKVSDDQLGHVFAHDLRAEGVSYANQLNAADVPTGRCIIVVTPDGQRTMNTFLGVASLLGPADVADAVVADSSVLYMEGYLWDRPEAMEAYRKAAAVAHGAGRKVSLTLSDSFCVQRHHEAFLDLVRSEVDILFANETEICALYGTDSLAVAYDAVREHCEIAAITLGAQGAAIVTHERVEVVAAEPVERVVDTTGAGDLFAAGFLYGLTHGAEAVEAARLGSVAAAEVIAHVGARPLVPLHKLA
jgi:sugar/nucleoside kinase (ribokinase family)